MESFKTYEAAKSYAQRQADETEFSYGLHRGLDGWVVRLIPSDRDNRYGWEATCEAVEPTSRSALFFCCRRRGSLGIATLVVQCPGWDVFASKHPGLEPLAVFRSLQEAQRYMFSETYSNPMSNVYRHGG